MNNRTSKSSQTKSKQRIADHGEVFTNEREVNAMLDLVKFQSQRIDSTFLEPACGTGNFLAEILRRKLATALSLSQTNKSQKSPKYSKSHYQQYAIKAISSIYGIELLTDNCQECQNRLLEIFITHHQAHFGEINPELETSAKFLLAKNIINGNALDLTDLNKNPIVFSEWTLISDVMVQRRDYIYTNLVGKTDNISPIDKSFIAKPIKYYSPTHYLKLSEIENGFTN